LHPIKNEIISAGSDILSGQLEAFEGKTTVIGDISHKKKRI
jgi:hypothetical protein